MFCLHLGKLGRIHAARTAEPLPPCRVTVNGAGVVAGGVQVVVGDCSAVAVEINGEAVTVDGVAVTVNGGRNDD